MDCLGFPLEWPHDDLLLMIISLPLLISRALTHKIISTVKLSELKLPYFINYSGIVGIRT